MRRLGFSTRHLPQVEAGRTSAVTNLIRNCEVLELPMTKLVRGLDMEGVYEALDVEIPPHRLRRS